MKRIVDKAIVLRRVNYGENDRVLTLLTVKHGKISVFAKGCRKQKSRLSGGIELLCLSEISFIDGKSDLKTLVSAHLIKYYDGIVTDINRTKQSFEALKKLDKLSDEGAGQEYFATIQTYLACLGDESYDSRLVEAWYGLQLLETTGVLGTIGVDGDISGDEFNFDYDKQLFNSSAGGAYSKDDIKLLRLLKSGKKPVKLDKALGSEGRVLNFTSSLVATNLT